MRHNIAEISAMLAARVLELTPLPLKNNTTAFKTPCSCGKARLLRRTGKAPMMLMTPPGAQRWNLCPLWPAAL